MGCHHGCLPEFSLSLHQSSPPLYARAEVGQDHQHRLHACPSCITLQECLQCSKTRHCWIHQDRGPRSCAERQHHLQLHLSWLCLDRFDQKPVEGHCKGKGNSRGNHLDVIMVVHQHTINGKMMVLVCVWQRCIMQLPCGC